MFLTVCGTTPRRYATSGPTCWPPYTMRQRPSIITIRRQYSTISAP